MPPLNVRGNLKAILAKPDSTLTRREKASPKRQRTDVADGPMDRRPEEGSRNFGAGDTVVVKGMSALSTTYVSRAPPLAGTERVRSNSLTMPEAAARPARKRTSSGVFQIDDSEPPQKKTELIRSSFDDLRKKTDGMTNGRRRGKGKETTIADGTGLEMGDREDGELEKTTKEGKVIEKFDSEAKTTCVSAFKESDSWD